MKKQKRDWTEFLRDSSLKYYRGSSIDAQEYSGQFFCDKQQIFWKLQKNEISSVKNRKRNPSGNKFLVSLVEKRCTDDTFLHFWSIFGNFRKTLSLAFLHIFFLQKRNAKMWKTKDAACVVDSGVSCQNWSISSTLKCRLLA